MDILFTKKGFIFQGKAEELILYLNQASKKYRTVKDFIDANLH